MLNQSQEQLRNGVRKFANVQGATALARHPDTDVNDYVNQAIGSLYRKLTNAIPTQRYLATSVITTSAGVSVYSLPSDFTFLISVELTTDGRRRWLQAFEMLERPRLVSPDATTSGEPGVYRVLGDNIEFLPVPNGTYSPQIWYTTAPPQLDDGGDTFDTISRLDLYITAFAARFIAIKDKNWDLAAQCKQLIDEMTPEIEALGRGRDRNSPPRILDVKDRDPWGRSGSARRRWFR